MIVFPHTGVQTSRIQGLYSNHLLVTVVSSPLRYRLKSNADATPQRCDRPRSSLSHIQAKLLSIFVEFYLPLLELTLADCPRLLHSISVLKAGKPTPNWLARFSV